MLSISDKEITHEEYALVQKSLKSGSEGFIQFIKDKDGQPIARKIFRENFGYYNLTEKEKERIRENKLAKITSLALTGPFQNQVSILNTISYQDSFIGYDMSYDEESITFSDCAFSQAEKIKYLKQIKEKLNYFHTLEIVYGDVRTENILYHPQTDSISFCDLDNVQVGSHPIDLYHGLIYPFVDENGLIDPAMDSYVYNFLLLGLLGNDGEAYHEILAKLKGGYYPPYIKEEGYGVLMKMLWSFSNYQYDGSDLTPYIIEDEEKINSGIKIFS